MNLHEYQGKELFNQYNLPVSKGIVIDDPENAFGPRLWKSLKKYFWINCSDFKHEDSS